MANLPLTTQTRGSLPGALTSASRRSGYHLVRVRGTEPGGGSQLRETAHPAGVGAVPGTCVRASTPPVSGTRLGVVEQVEETLPELVLVEARSILALARLVTASGRTLSRIAPPPGGRFHRLGTLYRHARVTAAL